MEGKILLVDSDLFWSGGGLFKDGPLQQLLSELGFVYMRPGLGQESYPGKNLVLLGPAHNLEVAMQRITEAGTEAKLAAALKA